MSVLRGLAAARGFAVGPVFVFRGDGKVPVPEYVVENGREGDELLRLKRSIYEVKRDLEGLVSALRQRGGREEEKIFESHLIVLDDPELIKQIDKLILRDHVNAEAAVRRAFDSARGLFERMNDPYFRERVRDIDDVERRLLKQLLGFAADPLQELRTPSIIVADDLSPSETINLPRDLVLGFATNNGSVTSHVALLARSMGIPSVAGLGDITSCVRPGETVLLDGTAGEIILSPTASAIRDFRDLIERQKEISEEASTGAPAGTLKDGSHIPLYVNLHPGAPFKEAVDFGSQGVGLYRTEYLWLSGEGEPTEDVQFEAYRQVAEFVKEISPAASVAIRVLDIGGDKVVRGISQRSDTRRAESNPFLGNRSIRYLLSHEDVFRTQLRAILRASAYGRVRILYPMVSCLEELRRAAVILDEVRADLTREAIPFDPEIPVGAMIEVPAAAIVSRSLAQHVDFFSLGTNDLIQYVMAADRINDSVAHLYQPTHPAVLRLIREVFAAAHEAGIPVCVCGETAADPIVGTLWVAMGATVLSMSATYLPVMSKVFSKLTRADLDEYARTVEAAGDDHTADELMTICRSWILSKIPDFDNFVI